MAVIKCKMCGGDLAFAHGDTIATCEYCGTNQTLPKVDSEIIQNLFNRANNLRLKCEFDKAEQIYEKILQQNDHEPEAHWGIILCKYGIEYVEDPKTFKRVPTCHRTSYDAVTADSDYLAAIENADLVSRCIYEAEAKAIDNIQKNILNIVKSEKPFDVFICYKESDERGKRTIDSAIANDIYHQLIQENLKVFYAAITLEDKLGQEYEPYIFAALNSAKVMLVLGTKPEHFSSVWVKNEWSRYIKLMKTDRSRLLIPCYRDMDAYDLPEEFAHLQAQDMAKIGFINDLVRGIKKVVAKDEPKPATVVKETVITGGNTNTAPLLKRAFMFLEDSDWKSANEYCEKVLDLDPECAEAYLGKLMAELNVTARQNLKNRATPFDNKNNFQKAMRFADEKLKKELQGYIDFIVNKNLTNAYNDAVSAMKSATTEDAYKRAAAKFEALGNFKNSEKLITECLEKAEEARLMALYNAAAAAMNSANTEQQYKSASGMFHAIKFFRDADEKAKLCLEKAEIARKDAILAKGKAKMIGDVTNYESAIKLFVSISGWRDADKQIAACQKIIAEMIAQEEADRLERERKAEYYRKEAARIAKRNKKIAIITTPIVCAIIAFLIVLFAVIIPNSKYSKAIALMEEGKYSEALSAFEALDGYKDSETKITECHSAILDGKYTVAIALMEEGKYAEAITAFEELDGYKDSDIKITECHSAILDGKYNNAIALMDAGNVIEAYEAFVALAGYKDSAEIASSIYGKYIAEKLKTAKVGDYIVFGAYEQDNNTANGKEEIEWLVLKVEDERILVISKYALDCKPYNTRNTDVTWETCTLRKWLNDDFINGAFSAIEKAMIPAVTVSADKNPDYSTNPGIATQDQVFLLSITEVNKYFSSDNARQCEPTDYAVANGAYVDSDNGNCWWWLRSPGYVQSNAAYVVNGGDVREGGRDVDYDNYAVRPAMWIDLSA